MTTLDLQWQDIDPWWDSYVQEQEADLVEVQRMLTELNSVWAAGESAFDQDPLCEAWERTDVHGGPLRPNQEENWSHWLAHLIRSSAGDFNRRIFGTDFDFAPESVRRERAFHDETEHDRRVDIIVQFADRGISIEVKKGDEHYRKTPQTAALTEKQHDRDVDWTHLLLLPKFKMGMLRNTFEDDIEESDEGRSMIIADEICERGIHVMYWRDVSRALRRTLLHDNEPATYWAASAFLFIILIEQQICQFHSQSGVKDLSGRGISDMEVIQSTDLDAQVDYLTTILGEETRE
jgi:hypothetical protein